MPLPCFATQLERLLPSNRLRHSRNQKAGTKCQYMVLCEPLTQYPSHVLALAAAPVQKGSPAAKRVGVVPASLQLCCPVPCSVCGFQFVLETGCNVSLQLAMSRWNLLKENKIRSLALCQSLCHQPSFLRCFAPSRADINIDIRCLSYLVLQKALMFWLFGA